MPTAFIIRCLQECLQSQIHNPVPLVIDIGKHTSMYRDYISVSINVSVILFLEVYR